MELKALDTNFNLISLLAPSNIQWNRKYYEAGDFEIIISASQYSTEMKYLYTSDRPELAVINKVSWERTEKGKEVSLSGFFMEKVIDDKIIYPVFYGSGEITSVLTQMVNQFKEDIPITTIEVLKTGSKVDFQETGAELGSKLYELLELQEMSYRVVYDFVQNKMKLEFYQGSDATQEGGADVFVTFSTEWDNLSEPLVETDDSNYKNYFVVAGTGEAEERITVEVDLSNGGYKKKLFVDERNTKFDSSEQTLDQYKLELKQKGLEKALDYQIVENIDFIIKPYGYEYMKDYDLGSKVDIIINDIGLTMSARIIAIYEVFKQGSHSIEIEVGNQVKRNTKLRQ